jgi:multidrug resistance protein MdtO
MVTASTLVMIVGVTFRIPYIAYAALFALILSRESLESTASATRAMVVGVAAGGVYVIVGALLVLGNPMLRFLWVAGTLFLAFYALSALSNYTGAARFAYLIVITIALWDTHDTAESKVENTLWAVAAIALGSVITLLMEMIFAAFRKTDDLTQGITDRLVTVQQLLNDYADGHEISAATRSAVTRLATVGTSRLRRILQRSSFEARQRQHMAALVALAGRLVDLAANLSEWTGRVADDDRSRIQRAVQNIAEILGALTSGRIPRVVKLPTGDQASPKLPLLREIEKTVSLMHDVFTSATSPNQPSTSPTFDNGRATVLVSGALSNPEHVKFALTGSLAAGLCYITYNALFWPGIATAVTTCLLTALTTLGASHQKQFLRFAGAIIGGLLIGIGAQVFILPGVDSIGGFTVLFVAVAGIAAWISTSSSRLSYLGAQIAAAFYLMNLQEFKFQASLAVARDRVAGILLGLFAMWLAFDWLWGAPAGVEMRRTFISAIRSLAQLAREPVSGVQTTAIERSYALRETINSQFDKVRSLADGVLFEFGPSREADLALRSRIREWQPQLRTLFLMRIASLKYRLRLSGFELPERILAFLKAYDDRSAALLDQMADWIEGTAYPAEVPSGSFDELELSLVDEPAANIESFATLLRRIDGLTHSLAEEIARDLHAPHA